MLKINETNFVFLAIVKAQPRSVKIKSVNETFRDKLCNITARVSRHLVYIFVRSWVNVKLVLNIVYKLDIGTCFFKNPI